MLKNVLIVPGLKGSPFTVMALFFILHSFYARAHDKWLMELRQPLSAIAGR